MEVAKIQTAEEKKRNETQISNWVIAGLAGGAVAVALAGTVYYVKSKRNAELKASRYGNSKYATVESYRQKLSRYWTFTIDVFTSVQGVVGNFLAPTKAKEMTPFVTNDGAESRSPFSSGDEVVESEAVL